MAKKAKPDRVAALAAEIRAYCEAHQDPSQKDKWARYFKEGYDSWGLLDKENPIFHAQQDRWFADYQDLGLAGFLRLGTLLFQSPKYEEGALAIRFLTTLRDQLQAEHLPELARWFEAGIRNWAHTDVLCGEILSRLLEDGRVSYEALAGWREAKLKFQRRAVPVSLLGMVKKGASVPPLLAFIEPLMQDPEREVHQGVGWFLREAWKTDPKPVERLLLKWKDEAPRLIFQYATEKMSAEQKERFRKSKK